MVLRRIYRRVKKSEDVTWYCWIPIFALIILSLIFAGGLYALEYWTSSGCKFSYITSLYLINTVHTTIGYGNYAPCSAGGKVLIVIYALIAIPLTLYLLDVLGKILAAVVNAIWIESYCFCCCFASLCKKSKKKKAKAEKKVSQQQLIEEEDDDDGDEEADYTQELSEFEGNAGLVDTKPEKDQGKKEKVHVSGSKVSVKSAEKRRGKTARKKEARKRVKAEEAGSEEEEPVEKTEEQKPAKKERNVENEDDDTAAVEKPKKKPSVKTKSKKKKGEKKSGKKKKKKAKASNNDGSGNDRREKIIRNIYSFLGTEHGPEKDWVASKKKKNKKKKKKPSKTKDSNDIQPEDNEAPKEKKQKIDEDFSEEKNKEKSEEERTKKTKKTKEQQVEEEEEPTGEEEEAVIVVKPDPPPTPESKKSDGEKSSKSGSKAGKKSKKSKKKKRKRAAAGGGTRKKKRGKGRKTSVAESGGSGAEKSELRSGGILPIWIGILLILFWILIAALVFWLIEDNWYYLDAVYFMYISITTIGFGDIAPEKHWYLFIEFFFIIIGLSLFSLCVNLIEQNAEKIRDKIEQQIIDDYQKTLDAGGMSSDPNAVKEMIQKHGGWKKIFISSKATKKLEQQYDKASNVQTIGTQTPKIYYETQGTLVSFLIQKKDHVEPKFNLHETSELSKLRREVPDKQSVYFPFLGQRPDDAQELVYPKKEEGKVVIIHDPDPTIAAQKKEENDPDENTYENAERLSENPEEEAKENAKRLSENYEETARVAKSRALLEQEKKKTGQQAGLSVDNEAQESEKRPKSRMKLNTVADSFRLLRNPQKHRKPSKPKKPQKPTKADLAHRKRWHE